MLKARGTIMDNTQVHGEIYQMLQFSANNSEVQSVKMTVQQYVKALEVGAGGLLYIFSTRKPIHIFVPGV
jgi:regulatory protein YycH of two-component signal transduction system YycFG